MQSRHSTTYLPGGVTLIKVSFNRKLIYNANQNKCTELRSIIKKLLSKDYHAFTTAQTYKTSTNAWPNYTCKNSNHAGVSLKCYRYRITVILLQFQSEFTNPHRFKVKKNCK